MKKLNKFYSFTLAILVSTSCLFAQINSISRLEKQMLENQAKALLKNHGPTQIVPLTPTGGRAVGDDCTTPIVVNVGALPYTYTDLNQYTCGRGNNYDNTDLGIYDEGEDIIYELLLTDSAEIVISMDPSGNSFTGLGLFSACPGLNGIDIVTGTNGTDVRIITQTLAAGTYYIMVDRYAYPCIPSFDLTINATIPPPLPPTAITTFPYSADFENGIFPGEFITTTGSESDLTISANAAAQGSNYGVLFEGASGAGYGGTPNSYAAAFDPSKASHFATVTLTVIPDGSGGILTMLFDLKQGFSFNVNYSWFRTLIDGNPLYDVDSNYYWQPLTHSDPFQTLEFDLSTYQNLDTITITLQSSNKYPADYYNEGDIAYLDNFELYYQVPGDIEGYVLDGNAQPVPGAIVNTNDNSFIDTTDATGYYLLSQMPTNWQIISASKEGYNTITDSVNILPDSTIQHNFTLTQPNFVFSPTSFNETLNPNEYLTTYLSILNNGDGEGEWEAVISNISKAPGAKTPMTGVVPYSIPAFTGSIPASTVHQSANLDATNNQREPAYQSNEVPFNVNLAGSTAWALPGYYGDADWVDFDIEVPGTFNIIDANPTYAAFCGDFAKGDNDNVYVITNPANDLYSVDKLTGIGTFVGATGLAGSIGSLASNRSTGDMYVMDGINLYTIDITSGATTVIGPHGGGGAAFVGLACDNSGALFTHDVIGDNIWSIDPATGAGTVIGPTGVNANYAQDMACDPETGIVYMAFYGGGLDGALRIVDTQTGGTALVGSFDGGAEVTVLAFPSRWLTLSTNAGTVPANGGSQNIGVNFNAAGTISGEVYTADIVITTDPDVGTTTIPVTMNISGDILPVVTNIQGSVISESPFVVELSWSTTRTANLLYYEIYRDDSVVGTSPTNLYYDTLVGYGTHIEHTYKVKAYYQEGVTLPGIFAFDWDAPAVYNLQGILAGENPVIFDLSWSLDSSTAVTFSFFELFRDGVAWDTVYTTSYSDTIANYGTHNYGVTAHYIEGLTPMAGPITMSWEPPSPVLTPITISSTVWYGGQETQNLNIQNISAGNCDTLEFSFPEFVSSSRNGCLMSIKLYDTDGDGWNGALIDVLVNGNVVLDDITLASGSGPAIFYFSVEDGDDISVVLVATGTFYNETSYEICDGQDNIMYTAPNGDLPLAPGTVFGVCASSASFVTNVQPNSGTLLNQEWVDISVVHSTDTLPPGTYIDTLLLLTNAPSPNDSINIINIMQVYYPTGIINVTPTSLTINQTSSSSDKLIEQNVPLIEKLKSDYKDDQLLVRFYENTGSNAISTILKNNGCNIKRSYNIVPNMYLVIIDDGTDVPAKAQQLESLGQVIYAEPDQIVKAIQTIPNDQGFAGLYGMHNTGQNGGTVDADIDAPEAWDIETGESTVIVGIIDSGMDYDHPDLLSNLWTNTGEIPNNGVDDDNNGYIDDIHGWDWAYGDNEPTDYRGHGTHVSGTVGAVGNNSIGVAGVCWTVKLMALKFLDDNGSGWTSDAISAIQYAANNGATLTSNSWGGGGYSSSLRTAILNSNMIFAAAAGNDGSDNDATPHYPSSFDCNNIIAVASLDRYNNRSGFSNYGVTSVDVGAYGSSILSTKPNNATSITFGAPGQGLSSSLYGIISGTSMATPQVAGLAALIYSNDPTLSWSDVKDVIMNNVEPVSALSGTTVTGGCINAFNSLISSSSQGSFTIENIGTGDLTVTSISDDAAWLTTIGYPTTAYTITNGSSQNVYLSVDWTLVGSTTQTGAVTILSNDLNEPSVTVTVTAIPSATITLVVTPSNRDVSSSSGTTTFSLASNTSWTVTDNAAWLSVSPTSGTNNGTLTATFTENTGSQRTGTITVSGTGVSSVDVTVTQAVGGSPSAHFTPVWSGYPYQPMNVLLSSATIDGSDFNIGDEIGIFDVDGSGNEICVGMATIVVPITSGTPLAITVSSDDPNTSDIDGFTTGNTIIYRAWSTGLQIEYTTYQATYNPTFDNVFTPLGTALVDVAFLSYVTQTIGLNTGWNIMSFYVVPSDMSLLNILQPLVTSTELIKVINEAGGFIQYIPGVGWMNTIGDMANTEGYYIKVTNNTNLDATGLAVTSPFNIPLNLGWNMMGYPCEVSQDALNALQPLITANELIKVINEAGGFIQYIPGVGWMNTIGNFDAGEGYYIKVNTNTNLSIICSASSSSAYDSTTIPKSQYFNSSFTNNPYYPMNILINELQLDLDIAEGDEIGVFDGELCVGVGVVSEDKEHPICIVASMDDPVTDEIDGFIEGNNLEFRYMSSKLSEPIVVYGIEIYGYSSYTPLETYVCNLYSSPDGQLNSKEELFNVNIYPNPTKAILNIEIVNYLEGHLQIELVNLLGKTIDIVFQENITRGKTTIRYDISDVTSGIYYLRFIHNANSVMSVSNHKLIVTN